MHAQRRANGVTLLAPTRTTRVNGGPRLAAGTPLPPFRFRPPRPASPSDPVNSSRIDFEPIEPVVVPLTPIVLERAPFELELDIDDTRSDGADDASFPLDAFIIPEGAARLPTGLAEADRRQRQRAAALADRLDALAARLRQHGYSALARQTVSGDPLDVLLAGVLAGYLAGSD